MLTQDEVAELETTLKRLADVEGNRLIRRREWGEINFEEVRPEIDSSIEMAKELLELPLSFIPKKELDRLRQVVLQLIEKFASINRFSLKLASPAQSQNELCMRLRSDSNDFESIAQPIVPYLRMKKGEVEKLTEELRETLAETKRSVGEMHARNEERLTEATTRAKQQQERTDEVLSKAQAAGARVGVAKFTQIFADEAKKLRWKSWVWLLVTAGLGAATLCFAVYSYSNLSTSEGEGVWQMAARMGSKGAILAVLFTGAVWCSRVYKAILHQATINKHRALSLQTFEAFVAATKDPEVKDAILLAAANASFGNTTTGLVDQKGSEGFPVGLYEATRNLKQGE